MSEAILWAYKREVGYELRFVAPGGESKCVRIESHEAFVAALGSIGIYQIQRPSGAVIDVAPDPLSAAMAVDNLPSPQHGPVVVVCHGPTMWRALEHRAT